MCNYGVNVSVIIPRPPDPTLPPSLSFSIDENSPKDTPVGTPLIESYGDGSYAGKVHFYITDYGGDGVKFFRVDKLTGQLYLHQSTLNFETSPIFPLYHNCNIYERYWHRDHLDLCGGYRHWRCLRCTHISGLPPGLCDWNMWE